MKTGTIRGIAESYINGNIGYTKKYINRMSKPDLLEFIDCLESYFYGKEEGNKNGYYQAISAVKMLLNPN
jgi:hypothetical protein